MDYDIDDPMFGYEKTRERNGLFHTFGKESSWDSEKPCCDKGYIDMPTQPANSLRL